MSSYEKQEAGQEELIDLTVVLHQFFKILRQMLALVLTLTVLGGAGYWALQRLRYTPQYTASAPFVVRASSGGIVNEYSDSLTAEQLANQFPQIINSSALQKRVMRELGLDYIPGTISLDLVQDTKLVTMRATARDPQMAYDILIAVLNNYEEVSFKVLGSTSMTLLREPVVPTEVDNPFSDLRQLAKGALGGLTAGLLIVLVFAMTRFTIKDKEDVKKQLNIPYLGAVPRVPVRRLGKGRESLISVSNERVGFGFQEGMRLVRSRLMRQMAVDEESETLLQKVILVTSAAAKEGSTTIAVNLALTMAAKGKRVILVDCNLRSPELKRQYGLPRDAFGIQDVLDGRCSLNDALTPYESENLLVMAGDRRMAESSGRILSSAMGQVLQALRQAADFVILDTPPAGAVADAGNLARYCDGIVVVIKQDTTRVSRIVRAVEELSESGAPILGCVLSATEGGEGGYGYGYGYSYSGYGYGYGNYGYGYGNYGGKQPDRGRKPKAE